MEPKYNHWVRWWKVYYYYIYCDYYSQGNTIGTQEKRAKRKITALQQGETKRRPTWTSWGLRQLQPMRCGRRIKVMKRIEGWKLREKPR